MRKSNEGRPLFQEVIERRFLLLGGKGGVGKTVLAATLGVHLANQGKKTLVYSVDPAHSLSDCFRVEIGNKTTKISSNLYALEINAKQLLDELKARYRNAAKEAFRFFIKKVDLPFERELMSDMMDLSPPGLDELMSLIKLTDILRTSDYDSIVVDMAAGMHAIRFIQLPQTFERWMGKMSELLGQYSGLMRVEDMLEFVETLKKDLCSVREILSDAGQSLFIPVTTAESAAISVAKDIIDTVDSLNIPVGYLIANQVISHVSHCDYCEVLKKEQTRHLATIHNLFRKYVIIELPLFPQPIDGLETLSALARVLQGERFDFERLVPVKRMTVKPTILENSKLKLSKDLRLVIFGGKGGCGKTTCSLATGVNMAEKGKKTLVVSSDPQRSLSTMLDQDIGNEIFGIRGIGNLYALQMDSEKLLTEFMRKNREEILEIVSSATYLEKEGVAEFLELSLPGLDEVMALIKLVDIYKAEEFDFLILDTAPTGHALRLLEMPDLLASWTRLLFKMRSKAKYIEEILTGGTRMTRPDIFLENLLKDIEQIKSLLKDRKTTFVPVTITEEMACRETDRLVSYLNNYGMHLTGMVINKVAVPNSDCYYCDSRVKVQLTNLRSLNMELFRKRVTVVLNFPHEIKGLTDLREFAKLMYD